MSAECQQQQPAVKTTCIIDPLEFDQCVTKLRTFFKAKGFIEVHTQSAQSILAACEDPSTIAKYNYNGKEWPLPQTGQMWLEHVLLKNPLAKGAFCVSTSYRNEPSPVPGRHELIFPMFEFESHGDMDDMIKLEKELLEFLGFAKTAQNGTDYPEGDYVDMAEKYGVKELENEHEAQLEKDYGPAFFLKHFPFYTSPFWNMKADVKSGISKKVDVIIHGIETIGSAERSTNPEEMRDLFQTISGGKYAKLLYNQFGSERVDSELEEFLSNSFFKRFGGGIGVTRMIRALKMSNLLHT
jgi:aspartyl/asparaginyl-tRNA synthetase